MESDILVVDGSAAIRKILQRVLRQTGMSIGAIHAAGDRQEALDLVKAHRVRMILTDINLPEMDGLQMLVALKAAPEWSDIPAVMITEGGESKVAEAVRVGAVGYVRKPFAAGSRRWRRTTSGPRPGCPGRLSRVDCESAPLDISSRRSRARESTISALRLTCCSFRWRRPPVRTPRERC